MLTEPYWVGRERKIKWHIKCIHIKSRCPWVFLAMKPREFLMGTIPISFICSNFKLGTSWARWDRVTLSLAHYSINVFIELSSCEEYLPKHQSWWRAEQFVITNNNCPKQQFCTTSRLVYYALLPLWLVSPSQTLIRFSDCFTGKFWPNSDLTNMILTYWKELYGIYLPNFDFFFPGLYSFMVR
jgi:hypothetical protein